MCIRDRHMCVCVCVCAVKNSVYNDDFYNSLHVIYILSLSHLSKLIAELKIQFIISFYEIFIFKYINSVFTCCKPSEMVLISRLHC